jgi:ubiquinone/menaquinone biosynthesis C-methylase UbiE
MEQPKKSEKEITRDGYDVIASEYAKRDQVSVPESEDTRKALDQFSSLVQKNGEVLDVGSGTGRDAHILHQKGFKVTGIDFSDGMLNQAQSRFPEIKFVKMDFENIPVSKKKFDGIWANASLHHVAKEKTPSILERLHAVLADNGVIFIRVKHGTFEGVRENEKFGTSLKRYFAFYQPEELNDMAKNAGFEIISSEIVTDGEWIDLYARKK